jgi:hypothetical protein
MLTQARTPCGLRMLCRRDRPVWLGPANLTPYLIPRLTTLYHPADTPKTRLSRVFAQPENLRVSVWHVPALAGSKIHLS